MKRSVITTIVIIAAIIRHSAHVTEPINSCISHIAIRHYNLLDVGHFTEMAHCYQGTRNITRNQTSFALLLSERSLSLSTRIHRRSVNNTRIGSHKLAKSAIRVFAAFD